MDGCFYLLSLVSSNGKVIGEIFPSDRSDYDRWLNHFRSTFGPMTVDSKVYGTFVRGKCIVR